MTTCVPPTALSRLKVQHFTNRRAAQSYYSGRVLTVWLLTRQPGCPELETSSSPCRLRPFSGAALRCDWETRVPTPGPQLNLSHCQFCQMACFAGVQSLHDSLCVARRHGELRGEVSRGGSLMRLRAAVEIALIRPTSGKTYVSLG